MRAKGARICQRKHSHSPNSLEQEVDQPQGALRLGLSLDEAVDVMWVLASYDLSDACHRTTLEAWEL